MHKMHRLVKLKDELNEIYLNQIIQTLAVSLIGIFIPIYLFEIGFDLIMIINYYMVFSLGVIFFSFLTAKISARIGLKHTIFLSTIPLITIYILLQFLGHYNMYSLFYLIPIIQGMWSSLYWIPLHSEFVKNSHKLHEGNEIGNLLAFPKLVATFAPFFGAVILKAMGFDVLFIMVIALIMLSVAPLFLTGDSKKRFNFDMEKFRWILPKNLHIHLFAEGILFVVEVLIWPLLVYFLFRDIMGIGILATITSIGVIAFTFVVSRYANTASNKRNLMRIGGIFYGLVLVARAFVTNMSEVYILSFLGGIFSTMIAISIYARFCDEARQGNILGANITRHMWLGIGRAVLLIVMLYLVNFQAPLEYALIVSGISIAALLLI